MSDQQHPHTTPDDSGLQEEVRALMDLYEQNPQVRDDIRCLLAAHESRQAIEERLERHARQKSTWLLLLACSGLPLTIHEPPTHTREISWAYSVMRRNGLKLQPGYEALLMSAYENFMDVLKALNVPDEAIQALLPESGSHGSQNQTTGR